MIDEPQPIFEIRPMDGGEPILIWENGRIQGASGVVINRIPLAMKERAAKWQMSLDSAKGDAQ